MATKWKKTYTDISNVNGGNEYETGDHITKETVNVALNNTAYLQQTKVTAESNKGLVTQQILANTDLNTVKTNGFYGVSQSCTNKPVNKNDGNLIVLQYDSSNLWTTQVYITLNLSENKNRIYSRGYNNSTNSWSSWKQIDNDPSLYNLGAYDTYVDNNDGTTTIKRKTGYLDLSKNQDKISQYDNVWYYSYSNIPTMLKGGGLKSPGYTQGNNKSTPFSLTHTTDEFYINNNSTTVKPTIMITYELATPYTEKIITGLPQITLDKQGCEWLRSEWEKGLNLFETQMKVKLTAGSEQWRNRIITGLVVGKAYTLYAFDNNQGYEYQALPEFHSFKNRAYTFVASAKTKEIRVGANTLSQNLDLTTQIMLTEGTVMPTKFSPYKGEIIRQSALENQVPMLGNQGNNKTMLGCRGQGYNTSGNSQYIYLAKWDNLNGSEDDSGIHIKGIIGGWMSATQAIIDVVASFREGWTFSGNVSQKQDRMDIVITSTGKVYLRIFDTQFYNYTIDIQCGNNGTITYTDKVLTSVDGTIQTALNASAEVHFPYFPLNGGLKANTSVSNWGVQTGSEVASWNDTTGGSFKFKRDCPFYGQMSLVIDGNVYVHEGQDKVLTSADVSNKLDTNATSIRNAQGEWFSLGDGHVDFGTSANATRIYSNSQPEWWKNGIKQGEIALKSDIVPYEPNDVADYGASSVKVDAGALYVFSVYIEDDRKFYTGSIYVPNNFSNPCRSAIIATFGNYKYLVTCGQRSSASAQGTLRIEKQLLDESAGTNTNSYFNKVFKMF